MDAVRSVVGGLPWNRICVIMCKELTTQNAIFWKMLESSIVRMKLPCFSKSYPSQCVKYKFGKQGAAAREYAARESEPGVRCGGHQDMFCGDHKFPKGGERAEMDGV